MKKVFLFLLLCFLYVCPEASAEEKPYIVKLRNEVQLFAEGTERKSQQLIQATEEELASYMEAGLVEEYIPNATVTLYGNYWNLDKIKAEFPQKTGCLGDEVKVAVIDSGLQPLDNLGSCALEGYNYLEEETGGDTSDTTDSVGHGTFVSGIIASETYGIAKNCKIIPLKCFDSKTGNLYYVLLALYDAVDKYNVDVINMSIGFVDDPSVDGYDQETMQKMIGLTNEAVQYATEKGAIVVAAVGNNGGSCISYPAGSPDSVGVGAVNSDNSRCSFSQYNNSVFIAAPGSQLSSTKIAGYTGSGGTSFAAPHVTAMAAVAKSMDKTITAEAFKSVLQSTATDLETEGYDVYTGYGLLDCEATVKALMGKQQAYISPVKKSGDKSSVVIYNNTETSLSLQCLFSSLDSDSNERVYETETTTLAKGEVYTFDELPGKGILRYFAWNGDGTLKPLSAVREYISAVQTE